MRIAFCIHTYCAKCNEEQDHSLQEEYDNDLVYSCDVCECEVWTSK